MKRHFGLLVLLGALTAVLVGCGPTPEPTEPAPTQTPWIIVVTATPGPGRAAQVPPTQTPWIVVATPTQARAAKPTATAAKPTVTVAKSTSTEQATASSEPIAEPTQTVETATAVPPTPSSTPEPGDLIYPAPVLLDPPPGARVSWRDRVVLKWDPVGKLAEDEYYCLQFDRPSTEQVLQPYGDYVYVKDTEFLWEKAFLAPFHPPEVQGEAQVFWWVRVVRKTGEDENGKPVGIDISPPSEKWDLILEPKPADA